jgi:hypothetical protein
MAAIAASMALVWQQRTGTHGPPARALAELERAGAAPSAETLARILRRGLITVVPHAASATPEEIAQLPDIAPEVQEAAALLLTLDRARFDPVAPAPDAQAVRRALERL